MAAGVKLAFWIALLFSYFPKVVVGFRYGHPSTTLHTSLRSYEERSEGGTHLLSADGSDVPRERVFEVVDEVPKRLVRSTKWGKEGTEIEKSVFALPDSHTQLIVHWAGQGSKVIVTLAGNSNQQRKNGTAVFISYDYGKSFNHIELLLLDEKTPGIINKFYNNQVFNSHYIFTDVINRHVFTTMDYGRSFSKTLVRFAPDIISLHSTNEKIIVAMDKNDTEKKVWLSEDFGETWDIMQLNVKSFFWGVKGLDDENVLYVERIEPSGQSSILKSPDFFKDEDRVEILIAGVEDFQVQDKYMFATRRRRLLGSKLPNGTLELWVSYKRGPFERAQFPNLMDHIDYYIPDASEDQVFVCVNHKDMHTNLYISDTKGIDFSLSLERILYFSPQGAGSDTWLSYVTDDTFADFHKVVGLRGIYIASQLKEGFEKDGLGPEDLITLITFDKGGEWRPLKPPSVDQHGKATHCTRANNCSLHLTQKFSQLYPVSRATPILSRSSAVGLIMASGVLGRSLKGHPAVFLSSDAGSSWHKVLDGSYFYTFGDHGGIIVAVKAYTGEGATNEFIYSTDEGETWQSVKFMNETTRVYGLMTEPGERSATFTLFGSRPERHQWLIVTVNLTTVFNYLCVADDYKQWSPSDPLSTGRQCLLGQQEVYQRRISHAKCYNGLDYERVVSIQKCECQLEDYECDAGFKWDGSNPPMCVTDKLSVVNPHAVPLSCKPGEFYKRSKGYRKIAGDVCEGGLDFRYEPQQMACPVTVEPEFVLFTQRHVINRMPLAVEGRIERLPVPNLKNVIAIEYDFQNNCIYWADIDEDKIAGLCLNGTSEPELLVETGLSSIEGLALDSHSNNLYFVDGEKSKIEVIRTDVRHLGRMRRCILNATQVDKPRGIALHPLRGFMFWTEWGSKPRIGRSSLSGNNITQLVSSPNVFWPNGIVIDNHIDRIYWVDAKLDYIASADFDGRHIKYLINNGEVIPHPFAIAIYKDWIYWDDWTRQAILMADKFDGSGVRVVASGLTGIMDLKIYDRGIQDGPNPCHPSHSGCTHLCMVQPGGGSVCLCPDGFQIQKLSNGSEKCLCDAGEEMLSDGSCRSTSRTCAPEQFSCRSNNNCIPFSWLCDGDYDCADKSDEMNCTTTSCASNQFPCRSGRCIPMIFKCDMDHDCEDGSDEDGCKYTACLHEEFACANGRCINKRFKCDKENDCRDGSDEVNCAAIEKPIGMCQATEFRCHNTSACIHSGWKCDGEKDCLDGSDEENCADHTCQPWQFHCTTTGTCIFATWRCDGDADCTDQTDELNCPSTTTPTSHQPAVTTPSGNCSSWMFACAGGNCIPLWWRCDRVSDCAEGSDEFDCAYVTPSNAPGTRTPPTRPNTCGENHFQCSNGDCIWISWVCDGEDDCKCHGEPGCVDRLDEVGCFTTCGPDHFRCIHSAGCIPKENVCNGVAECGDRSDEMECSVPEAPNATLHICDGNDERVCKGGVKQYSVQYLEVNVKSITNTSFGIQWQAPFSSNSTAFSYLPSISESTSNLWINFSWIRFEEYVFIHLQPFSRYNFTVYIKINGTDQDSNALVYKEATTLPGVPSPPINVDAKLEYSQRVNVTWQPPVHPNNVLLGYRVYISPPNPPQRQQIIGAQSLHLSIDTEFQPGTNYSIWVTAFAEGMESSASNRVIVSVPADAITEHVENLKCADVNNITATLNWTQLKQAVDSYVLTVVPNMKLSWPETQSTKAPPYEVTGLAPGTVYTIKVAARKGDLTGPPSSVRVETKGDPLQVPRNVEGRVKGTIVQLSWELPHDSRNIKWIYGITYGLSEEDLEKRGIVGHTQELTYSISSLESCKKYIFDVRIFGPFGLGPSNGGIFVTTDYDPRAPPVGLNVHLINGSATANITWKASCDIMTKKIGYQIRIYDTVREKEAWFQMAPTSKSVITYPLTIRYGGHYTIQVQTTQNESKATAPYIFHGPKIPSPNQLKLLQTSQGSFQLEWSSRELPAPVRDHKYSFVVLVSDDDNLTDAVMYKSNRPSMPLDVLLDGRQYYIAVQLKDENGFTSEPSEVLTFVKPVDNSSVVLSSTSLVGVSVPIIVVVIALLGALSFLYMRHRRLQRATLSFANSHYNTRSGATTFSTSDDLDEEDSPMIHGFSDDEPLVIA